MILVLSSLEATAALAKVFADCVTGSPSLPPVLLRGQLGAGKTTFIRELVQSLEPLECSILPLATGILTRNEEEADLVVFAPEPALLDTAAQTDGS